MYVCASRYYNTCPRVATMKFPPFDALWVGVYLRAIPLAVRTQCVESI